MLRTLKSDIEDGHLRLKRVTVVHLNYVEIFDSHTTSVERDENGESKEET